MPTYNSITSRTEIAPLIPEDVARGIIQTAADTSAVLARFRRVTMAASQQRMPVLSALPVAYFVNGDTGLKQTTEMAWANKYLNVEELATIVPIADAVLEDSSLDLWGEVRPRVTEAIGRKLDAAVFFGVDAPGSWPTNIGAAAVTAANVVTLGTAAAAAGGVAEDLNQVWAKVEADGFDVNGVVTERSFRSVVRGVRDTTGQPIQGTFTGEGGAAGQTILGEPVTYAMRGLWPTGAGTARLFAGDWSQFIVGVRRDITVDFSKEAVITDNSTPPNIIYNLWQQDMTAMRVTFRVAWQVSNPMTLEQPTESARYPVAVLRTAP